MIKSRVCKIKDQDGIICGKSFTPRSSLQVVCSPSCAISKISHDKEIKSSRIALDHHRSHRIAKEKARTTGYYAKRAQAAFNAFIRERDRLLPCVSCGRLHPGQYHAGHYRSVGSSPELRFCEINVHKQCSACNNYLSGNIINYRMELLRRIGNDGVDWLEGPHEATHLTQDDFKRIEVEYKHKLKEIKNN